MILLYHFCLQKKLDILSKVYILIFCLSYGQSAVERGFSANKEYIKENQSENCLVSPRIIHNHLTSKKVTASSITITADMITFVRSAQLKYEQFQIETSEKKKATEALQRKIVTNELEQVKQNKICLKKVSVNQLKMQMIKCPSMQKKIMICGYLVDRMTYQNLLIVKERRLMTQINWLKILFFGGSPLFKRVLCTI